MTKLLSTFFSLLLFSTLAFAEVDSLNTSPVTLVDGTLSITMDSAPAPGVSTPKVVVLRGFTTVRQNNVNWGDTWTLTLPSDNYRIVGLPVTDGTNFFVTNTLYVFVPPGGVVNPTITYHAL